MRRSNKERSETMRLQLIEAARRLFVEKGYAETATPEIAATAGVTRGALYHHFEDKKALFHAVVEHEARKLAEEIGTAAAPASDPKSAILAGTRAYFDAMTAPGRTRLLLLDGPAVLGPRTVRNLDAENSEAALGQGLTDLAGDRQFAPEMLQAFTLLLSAAFDRAALAIADGGDRESYETAIAAMIDAIAVK